ncbi:MAG: helix-turn-helix transcriptional regulator [Clostridia bacterium]|nr:helix-turn-helix transcriptional regulator [Clostridia bacterium]
MSIGSTIKRLRREKDITQEQLAEYLGITSRAVSQWECDRTSPDISQLPALCHIFDVSSDVLLGIDIEKNNEEIKNIWIQRKICVIKPSGRNTLPFFVKQTKNSRETIRSCRLLQKQSSTNTQGKASRNTKRCLIFAIGSLRNVLTARSVIKLLKLLELPTTTRAKRTKC